MQLRVDMGERLQPRAEFATGAAYPLATARTSPWSRVNRVTIRSASPSLCWRSTTARSRYSRIPIVLHPAATLRGSAPLVSYPVIGASESGPGALSGSGSGSGNRRLPTLTDLLYQLASRSVSSTTLVGRSLHAIHASQPTLNAFRVVLTESALADAAEADRRRAAGTPPAAGHSDRRQGRRRHCRRAHRLRHRGLGAARHARCRGGSPPQGRRRGDRWQNQHL